MGEVVSPVPEVVLSVSEPPSPEPVLSVAISPKPELVLDFVAPVPEPDFSKVVSSVSEPRLEVVSLVPEPVLSVVVSSVPDDVPLVGDGDGLKLPVAVSPGCWHCHDGSGAQDPSSCSRHCAYAAHTISRYLT